MLKIEDGISPVREAFAMFKSWKISVGTPEIIKWKNNEVLYISNLRWVDHDQLCILGLYTEYCLLNMNIKYYPIGIRKILYLENRYYIPSTTH